MLTVLLEYLDEPFELYNLQVTEATLTFLLEESGLPFSMTVLDCVMMCSISLEQEACNMVPNSSEAGNAVMYPKRYDWLLHHHQ